ncbi:MAG: cobalamin-dependent protein [Candidatus Adiutrix sp.]|jgi:radical SAM superfamily enzyme YgiQ (UPF0313 family)|nr:cobalamin-dependent protein [Candidatus Adiutrix sp.]
MRVMILSANFFQLPYPVYPLGASAAAELARQNGHQARLVDLLADNQFSGGYDPARLAAHINEFQPDCLGLSLRNLESADSSDAGEDWSLDILKSLVAELRRLTKAPLVLGGAGFSLMPEQVLRLSGADYGLPGEGEEIWPAFLNELNAGRARPGLQPASGPVARQLAAYYDPDLVRAYDAAGGLIGVQSKRGCPLNCLYCSYPLLEGRRIRPRPAAEVLDDLRFLARHLDSPQVAFADAVFNDPRGYWRELLEALASSGLKIRWTAFFQPAELSREDLRLIKASGASGLEFGTDGACDATLAGLNKPFRFDLVRRLQENCRAAGVPAAHYIIFGGPGENEATVEEGLRNLEELRDGVVFAAAGLSVYPRTPLFDLAFREGLVPADGCLDRPLFYFSPQLAPARLDARLRRAFGARRDRLYPANRAAEQTRALRRLGFRGILWDTLIGAGTRRGRRA